MPVGELGRTSLWEGRSQRLAKKCRLPAVVALLSVALALPALTVGWVLDDYYHRAVLLETSRLRELIGRPSEMFRFFRGDPVRTGRLLDVGLFPWWTYPRLKAEFLQALTVLTHRLDYALWPNSPAAMHAHSLLWLGAMVAVTTVFYRRMLGATWVAAIAALLFALDDARGATVGFLANRNVLVAATFGVSALITHDRWRRDGSRVAAALALLLLGAALFSKEEGIGTCAYLAAYGLFIDPAGRRRGCLALAPYVGVVFAWRALRASWDYGVRDVGIYIDPLTEPGRFFPAAVERVPILLLGQWSPIPAEFSVVLRPEALVTFCWVAVAVLAFLLLVLAPLLRRSATARFWGSGMLFAAVPVSATLPMDRLLTFVGIGAFGLLAQFWAFAFGGLDRPPSRIWRATAKALAVFLIVVHAVIAPLSLPFRAGNPLGPKWIERRLYVPVPLAPQVGERTVVIVNAPSPVHANYLIFRQEQAGLPVPRYVRTLAPAIPSVTIRRVDEQTLEIQPDGGYLQEVLDRVFRSERLPFVVGERVNLPGMTAEVRETTPDGRPDTVRFRLDVPLESPSLYWLCFRRGGFEPFSPPAIGQQCAIGFDWRATFLPGAWSSEGERGR